MFAIIDIETTGGRPDRDSITEIAVVIHDGTAIVDTFCSLLNPEREIPYYISKLTGITNDMVHNAPKFYEIAKHLVELTTDCVFVAHNVNFDYNFIKSSFKNLGYDYNRKTLCTVKLSRKTFIGLPSYSLGKLCESLKIEIKDRHRALGDAEATAILFDRILKTNPTLLAKANLKSEIKKHVIPIELDEGIMEKIPESVTGVYYFHNKAGDVIYVGKSVDIKKRIQQHFAISAKGNRRSLDLKAEMADITFENTGSELIALLVESEEIKKLKPKYNRQQIKTRAVPFYGIFYSEDEQGYLNLYIDRIGEDSEPLYTMDGTIEAQKFLYDLIEKHMLCLSKCDMHQTGGSCFNHQIKKCLGACCNKEKPSSYNLRVQRIIDKISFKNESFFMVDKGRNESEKSIVCIEKGIYKGYAFVDISNNISTSEWRSSIKKSHHNKDIRAILKKFSALKLSKVSFNPDQLMLF